MFSKSIRIVSFSRTSGSAFQSKGHTKARRSRIRHSTSPLFPMAPHPLRIFPWSSASNWLSRDTPRWLSPAQTSALGPVRTHSLRRSRRMLWMVLWPAARSSLTPLPNSRSSASMVPSSVIFTSSIRHLPLISFLPFRLPGRLSSLRVAPLRSGELAGRSHFRFLWRDVSLESPGSPFEPERRLGGFGYWFFPHAHFLMRRYDADLNLNDSAKT